MKQRVHEPAPRRLYADPSGRGYGGPYASGQWPFDYTLAAHDPHYRGGVWRAYRAAWTAPNWKAATSILLDHLWRDLAHLRRVAASIAPDHPDLEFERLLAKHIPLDGESPVRVGPQASVNTPAPMNPGLC